MLRPDVQSGKRIARASFLVATNLATDMVIETAYIYKTIGKTRSKKSTPKQNDSSPVIIKESIDNAAFLTNKMDSTQGHSEDVFNK